MKIKVSLKAKQLGNALLTALVICAILCISVMGYLTVTEQESLISARSQTWNIAISIVEAGVEEALEQLNTNTSGLSSDGWSFNGTVYSRTRNFADGNSYTVTIDLSSDPFNPTIISRAFINLPSLVQNASPVFFAAGGVPTQLPSITRAVRVRCARGNLFIKGMVAKHQIDMNGNDILTDSFDSSDPAYSTSGHYAAAKRKSNGDVATNDKFANSLSAGNANIYGHVITGPGGSVAVGTQGGVGDYAWVQLHKGQIEPGYFADDANFTFPDTSLPYTTGLTPASGTITTTNYILGTNAINNSSTYPNPVPMGGVITNTTWASSTVLPSPIPPGIITNCASTNTSSKGLPASGTYCGAPWQSNTGNDVKNTWYYYKILGYTWPNYTYTYNLYSTNYTTSTTNWDHILMSGDYSMDTLSGKTLVLGNARLVVPNGINMTGNDLLQIGQFGSIQVYAGGTTATIGGNGVVNLNGFAINCQIYCTPTVTAFNFNGNGEFIGVLVAPEAAVQMNGGGHIDNDFIGALMASSVKMNGHYSFHYDEFLGKNPASGRFIVKSWDEIP